MRYLALLLFTVAVAHASVAITRTSDKAMHPMEMEIEVQLPNSNRVRVPLTRTDAFENVPITMMENGISMTFSAHQLHHLGHSHYRDIESRSVVSVRHVNGKRRFSGHVTHEGASYFLEPKGDADHQVTRNEIKSDSIAKQIKRTKLLRLQSRRKRQAPNAATTNVVEILVLLDHTVWNAIKSSFGGDDANTTTELHYYYSHILTGVDTAYRNIGTPSISVKCIGMVVAKTQADDAWMPTPGTTDATEASSILGTIKTYSLRKVADHVMAFTRTDIRKGTNKAVTGMAPLSGVCTEYRQSINEDLGLHSWATGAHELGHNLGAEHDSAGCSPTKSIMAQATTYTLSDISNSYLFSNCAVNYIKKYIGKLDSGSCLKSSQGSAYADVASKVHEGARLTLNKVCKLVYPSGPGKHFMTDSALKNSATICAQLYCYRTAESKSGIIRSGLRAPVGTPCGNKKSCNWRGQCTFDSAAPEGDEFCFWGDDSYCTGWADYIKRLRGESNTEAANNLCDKVRHLCCNSLKTLCPLTGKTNCTSLSNTTAERMVYCNGDCGFGFGYVAETFNFFIGCKTDCDGAVETWTTANGGKTMATCTTCKDGDKHCGKAEVNAAKPASSSPTSGSGSVSSNAAGSFLSFSASAASAILLLSLGY